MEKLNIRIDFGKGYSEVPIIKKIYVLSNKELVLKRQMPGSTNTEIIDFNFEQAIEGEVFTGNMGYTQNIYQFVRIEDEVHIKIATNLPDDQELPEAIEQTITDFADPTYLYVADGETETEEQAGEITMSDFVPSTLTYPEKQERAVDAIINFWRPWKRQQLKLSAEYTDLVEDLPTKLGKWLRAADRALQIEFQDPTVDPLVVAKMAKMATEGAKGLREYRDKPEVFFRKLKQLGQQFPNGPVMPIAWVTKDGPDPERVESIEISQALQAITYQQAGLPADYDSTEDDWIVENQPGFITVMNLTPNAETVVSALLTDYDGIDDSTVSWQWQSYNSDTDVWSDIEGATAFSYTIPADATIGDIVRAKATYTDNYAADQEAISDNITVS